MKNKKLCCRIFPIVLILISSVIAIGIWYFEEDLHEFAFLNSASDFITFFGTVLFVSIIPIGMFYYLNDIEKYQSKARQISLLGFIPSVLFLGYILL